MSTTAFSSSRSGIVEWPTLGLIAAVYATLAILVWHHAVLPWWIILPLGAYCGALHSSLQHEVLHGHPTRSRMLNEALVFVTPLLWLPFARYRDTHLTHHNDAHLTDPVRDPESYYMLPEHWARLPGIKRKLYIVNQTLGGRMLIGPMVSIARFWGTEWKAILSGDLALLPAWISFAAACACTLVFVTIICGMPFWQYYLLIAYPGIAMALIRSYCEHQAAENVGERTIIVEASPFWGLLFLNNNLHVAHHTRPALPWYDLPRYYAAERDVLVKKNNGYLKKGYGEIFRQYLLTPKEPVPYPNMGWLDNPPRG